MAEGPSIRVAKAPVFRIALSVVGKARSSQDIALPIGIDDVDGLPDALANAGGGGTLDGGTFN